MSEGRGETVALLAGGGVLLWWLLRRGKGGWFGSGDGWFGSGNAYSGPARPCKLRLTSEGLSLDGRPAQLTDAVAACKPTRRAELVVTGDAAWGELEKLRAALRSADIAVAERIAAPPVAKPSNGHRPPARGRRVSRSTIDATRTVNEPPEKLLAQARAFAPDLTMDEYTAARLIASEHGSGSLAEMAAIVDSELNRAERRGKGLFESLTWKRTFGSQGKRRQASTRLDPYEVHLRVAQDVLGGAKRGISRGATRFFDPHVQLAMARKDTACAPLVILERWAFNFPWLKVGGIRKGCELDRRKSGGELLEWVGEIEGIDPTRLLLMRPALPGPDHVSRYLAAKELIETRLLGGKTYA